MLQAFCDGSIVGGHWGKKTGPKTIPKAYSGWWVRDAAGQVLHWKSIDLGEGEYMSANVAEYFAVRSALRWLAGSVWRNQGVEVNSDSQVVIRQLQGKYHCYEPKLITLRDACLKLAQTFPRVVYRWIRREQNKEADVLSKALQVWGRQAATWDEVLGAVK